MAMVMMFSFWLLLGELVRRNNTAFNASENTSKPPKKRPVPAGIFCSDTNRSQKTCFRLLAVAMSQMRACAGERPKLGLIFVSGEGGLKPKELMRLEATPCARIAQTRGGSSKRSPTKRLVPRGEEAFVRVT